MQGLQGFFFSKRAHHHQPFLEEWQSVPARRIIDSSRRRKSRHIIPPECAPSVSPRPTLICSSVVPQPLQAEMATLSGSSSPVVAARLMDIAVHRSWRAYLDP